MNKKPRQMGGESSLAGVTVRTWCAAFLIVVGTTVLAYKGAPVDLKELVLMAMSFLFGRASNRPS